MQYVFDLKKVFGENDNKIFPDICKYFVETFWIFQQDWVTD